MFPQHRHTIGYVHFFITYYYVRRAGTHVHMTRGDRKLGCKVAPMNKEIPCNERACQPSWKIEK